MNFYINIDNKIFGYENKYKTNECTVHNACRKDKEGLILLY